MGICNTIIIEQIENYDTSRDILSPVCMCTGISKYDYYKQFELIDTKRKICKKCPLTCHWCFTVIHDHDQDNYYPGYMTICSICKIVACETCSSIRWQFYYIKGHLNNCICKNIVNVLCLNCTYMIHKNRLNKYNIYRFNQKSKHDEDRMIRISYVWNNYERSFRLISK